MIKMTPLPAGFMVTAMLGLVITTVYTVAGKLDLSWGIAFDIVFAVMFVASILSVTPSAQQAEFAEKVVFAERVVKKGVKRAKRRKKR